MVIRVAVGRAEVVRDLRAAGPLMAELCAPVTARAPWLTAVLDARAARRGGGRPVAVVVEPHPRGRPEAVAFLTLRRRGVTTRVSLLGDGVGPVPGGRPPARLLARDEAAAERLAEGICDLLDTIRGPRRLHLAGLPLGDPTARSLAARLPDGLIANGRSGGTVDGLDGRGPVLRSRDPREIDRWLPVLLAREPDRRKRAFLRTAVRLHAAIHQVELAVLPVDGQPGAALLTLVDGGDRWPGGAGPMSGVSILAWARRWSH